MGYRWLTVALVATLLLAACDGGGGDAPAQPTATARPSATAEEVTLPLSPDQPALYVVNTDGSGLRKLFDQGNFIEYAIHPDGRRIAVSASEFAGGSVYLLDASSGQREKIVGTERFVRSEWSPDGRRLALTGQFQANAGSGVYLYSIDDRTLERLQLANATFVAWSVESTAVFVRQFAPFPILFRVDVPSLRVREIFRGQNMHPIALSPDGRWLAVGSSEGEGDDIRYIITVMRPDGSDSRMVVRLRDEPNDGIGGLAWSPDSQRLAYGWTAFGEARGAYVMDVSTRKTIRLTQPTDGFDRVQAWASDGKWLLVGRSTCTACDSGSHKFVVARTDGSGELPLSRADQFQFRGSSASWSPDGVRIAYSGNGVYVADSDGSNASVLADLPVSTYREIRWSPSGGQIFFVRQSPAEATIYAVAPDGANLEELGAGVVVAPDGETVAEQTEEGFLISRPGEEGLVVNVQALGRGTWSPDSSRLAFVVEENGGRRALVILGIDGSLQRLPPHGRVANIRWSPGGITLAYLAEDAVWVVDATTGERARVAEISSNGRLAWSADGDELAIDSRDGVIVVAPDGSMPPRRLFSSEDGGFVSVLGWSRAGELIAVDAGKLLIISAETGAVEDTFDVSVTGFAWAPEGRGFAYSTCPRRIEPADGVFIVDQEGEVTQLTQTAGRRHRVDAWLSTGRIVFSARITLC